jgi:hypothetical protein
MSKEIEAVKQSLAAQHPLHGILGNVFERLGGEQFVYEWAEDNPGRFISLIFGAAPKAPQVQGMTGDVTIVINNALQPTELDSVMLDEQGRIID